MQKLAEITIRNPVFAAMIVLSLGVLPLPVLFMVAFAIAMLINYPRLQHQKDRITAHAGNVLGVVSLIFAAGVFTGILSGTKMDLPFGATGEGRTRRSPEIHAKILVASLIMFAVGLATNGDPIDSPRTIKQARVETDLEERI